MLGAAACSPVADAAGTDAVLTAELVISGAAAAEPAACSGLHASSTPSDVEIVAKAPFCPACGRQPCLNGHIPDMLLLITYMTHVAALPVALMMRAQAATVRARPHPGSRLFLTS